MRNTARRLPVASVSPRRRALLAGALACSASSQVHAQAAPQPAVAAQPRPAPVQPAPAQPVAVQPAPAQPAVQAQPIAAPPPPPVRPDVLSTSNPQPAPAPTTTLPAPRAPTPTGLPVTVTARAGSGITLRSNDGSYMLNMRGVLAVREALTFNPNGRPVTNELSVRRARLVFSGNIFSQHFQYYLALGTALFDAEIAPGAPLYEAYFNLSFLRDLNVRVGQMFIPHSRLAMTSISNLELVDRPYLYRELNTDRDIGVMFHSNNLFGINRFQYNAGIFSGEGLPAAPPTNAAGQPIGFNALNTVLGFLYVFRLQCTPLGAYDDVYSEADLTRSARPRWSFGVSGAYNQNALRERSTQGQLGPSRMDYAHWTADMTFKYRGLSLLGEFLYREGYEATSTLLPAAVTPGYQMADRVPFLNRSLVAYYAQAGIMFNNYLGFAARWEHSIALANTDPSLALGLANQGYAVTGGLSGYLFQHFLKVQLDYSYRFGPANLDGGQHIVRLQAQTFL